MKIGMALGGGGARGFFHLGVLKVLEAEGIKVDFISGTSMGALIGGLYSVHNNSSVVIEKIFRILDKYHKAIAGFKSYSSSYNNDNKVFWEKSFNFVRELYLWNRRMLRPYMLDSKPFLKLFKELFGSGHFGDCRIPFVCLAVDIISGVPVELNQGQLYKAVLASCSLPGVFPPLKIDDRTLVDGGVLVPLPSLSLRNKADFVIGVNLEAPWEQPSGVKNAVESMVLVDKIRYKYIVQDSLKNADFLISIGKGGFAWVDFDRIDELISLGEEIMAKNMDNLLDIMRKYEKRKFFTLGFWQRHTASLINKKIFSGGHNEKNS